MVEQIEWSRSPACDESGCLQQAQQKSVRVEANGILVDWLPSGERGLATDLLTSTKPKDVGLILGPFTHIYSLRAAGGEEFHGSSMVACAAEDNRAPDIVPDVCTV